MSTIRQTEPAPGDYYGVIYEGPFITPILVLIVLALAIWLFVKRRN